jgi:hypothetical protein
MRFTCADCGLLYGMTTPLSSAQGLQRFGNTLENVDNAETMSEENHMEKQNQPAPSSPAKQESLIEIAERADKLQGPVGEILRALAQWIAGSRTWNWRNALLIFGFLIVIYVGLIVLVWNGKVDSNTLAVSIGVLIGVAMNFLKSIFPSRE